MNVNIYIYIDSKNVKKTVKRYGYVLETIKKDGTPATVEGFGTVEGTYNAATLTAMIESMARITKPCTVQISIDNDFVGNAAVKSLPGWAEAGFRKKNGAEIANKDLFEKLWIMWKTHEVSVNHVQSEYQHWLERETIKTQI